MISAVVHAKRRDVQFIEARVLLDTCSTANFVTTKFAQRLRLSTQPCALSISGMNKMHTKSSGSIDITIRSRITGYEKMLRCLIVPEIANRVPASPFPREVVSIPKNIRLADP